MAERRTLVLSVDRDDDIGYKAGLEGPVVGRDACIAAANALALVDPEDSDVNAIFQAVKVADGLAANCEAVEVAIVAGDHLHMIEGDRKIARDLERVIARTGATECILVTDGAEDDFVLPIIQSRIAGASPSIEVLAVRRKFALVTPGTSTGYCIARKRPALARSSTDISVTSSPSSSREPLVTSYRGWPAIA